MTITKSGLLERFAGDEDLLNEVFEVFVESSAEELASLSNAFLEKDFSAIHNLAHTLKGSVSNFSSELATDICGKLESAAKEEDWEKITEYVPQVQEEFQKLTEDIQKLLTN